MHKHQALVLVNNLREGGANGEQLLALAEELRDGVWKRFSIRLEIEPRVYGRCQSKTGRESRLMDLFDHQTIPLQLTPERQSSITFWPNWLSATDADKLLDTAISAVDWRADSIKIVGKQIPIAALAAVVW